jgi:(p)ppGpp synthase/HD superfamily hydrolase
MKLTISGKEYKVGFLLDDKSLTMKRIENLENVLQIGLVFDIFSNEPLTGYALEKIEEAFTKEVCKFVKKLSET